MDSRINKGNYIQIYSFCLIEPNPRHVTREPGGDVASQQEVPASVKGAHNLNQLKRKLLRKRIRLLSKSAFLRSVRINFWDAEDQL